MERPRIREAIFDAKMDPGINTRVLRDTYEIVDVEYGEKEDKFAGKVTSLRFRIEDQHDDESKPHYVLDVEIGDWKGGSHRIYSVRYCDYHSTTITKKKKHKKKKKKNVIVEAPGCWRIHIWLPKGSKANADEIASAINLAYGKAMEAELPDYEILFAKKPCLIKK